MKSPPAHIVASTLKETAARVEAGKDACAAMEIIGEQPVEFWERLQQLVAAKLPVKVADSQQAVQAMGDIAAKQFEREQMPFGKYAGWNVGDIPRDYFYSILEDSPFTKDLRRYVASERFQNGR